MSSFNFDIGYCLTQELSGDETLSFPSPYPFYGHIAINDDQTATNEDEWDVIIECYGRVSISSACPK